MKKPNNFLLKMIGVNIAYVLAVVLAFWERGIPTFDFDGWCGFVMFWCFAKVFFLIIFGAEEKLEFVRQT